MEIKKLNEVNIYINNERADVFSQDGLNLRFNNMFTDPTKIQTVNTEYSFSFVLPITPTNNKIFDYANVLSKRSKFNKRYKTNVDVGGSLVFSGDLLLTSVSSEGYKCNLYVNKLNTIDKIFGESKLSEITDWYLDYSLDATINMENEGDTKYPEREVFFPFVSYGMFQKSPKPNDTYTSKYEIDDYNTLYNENFYPSHSLLATVKRCFKTKGYEVDGDVFDDEIMRRIYMSTHLGKDQDPLYNYGTDEMGKFSMNFTYSNFATKNTSGGETEIYGVNIPVDLDEPKYFVGSDNDGVNTYNWEKNNIYDVWSSSSLLTTDIQDYNDILWRDNCLYAPMSGYYKISLTLDYEINQSKKFNRYYYYRPSRNSTITRSTITYNNSTVWTFDEFFTEFQLVKNSADGTDVKMICPDYIDEVTTYSYSNSALTTTNDINKAKTSDAYPHEAPAKNTWGDDGLKYPYGYCPQPNSTLNYDPRVNKNFILGCTTSGAYNYTSVIKNGNSWDRTCTDTSRSRYKSNPYLGIYSIPNTSGGRGSFTLTSETTSNDYIFGDNTLDNSTMTITRSADGSSAHTQIDAIVYLEKNDILQLKMVQRRWNNKASADDNESDRHNGSRYQGSGYQTDAIINVSGNILFRCFSPDDIPISSDYFNWNNDNRYPTKLNLANFLSNEERMSDFINNFINEFNLSYQQSGNLITINKQKIDFNTKNCVYLTDRVSENEIESEVIDFPSQMSVEYNINESERGFYISAEKNATEQQMQANNWKDYADRGYDVLRFSDDEDAEESKVTTKTSYCWYDRFHITQDGQDAMVDIPIIANDEWMIDGYKDAEFMKEDGYSFNRRYWFPSTRYYAYVNLCGNKDRQVYVKLCSNKRNGVELSYKNNGETLLTRFFNIDFDVDTNYVTFECYLTTEEYSLIKNGSNIIIDDDVYIPIELQGFDVSGNNKTKIRAIKK